MPGTIMAGRVLERNNGGLFFDGALSAFVFAKPALLAMAPAMAAATGLKQKEEFISVISSNKIYLILTSFQRGFKDKYIRSKW